MNSKEIKELIAEAENLADGFGESALKQSGDSSNRNMLVANTITSLLTALENEQKRSEQVVDMLHDVAEAFVEVNEEALSNEKVSFTSRPLELEIDLNDADRNGLTIAHVRGGSELPKVGTAVVAFESEDDVEAPAIVVKVIKDRRLVLLLVKWRDMRDRVSVTDEAAISLGTSETA